MGFNLKLFRFLGIDVYLDWTWIIYAVFRMSLGRQGYTSHVWTFAEFVSVFAIVLMHEYGHALAARSVGGRADRIVLWPLGGIAYAQAPFRPGAQLWTIIAGPLVNVVLLPILFGLAVMSGVVVNDGFDQANNLQAYLFALTATNIIMILFNLLPIYPLDGGQILWSLLWFVIGPVWSLKIVTVIGLIAAVGLFAISAYLVMPFMMVMAAFIAMQAWSGWKTARMLEAHFNGPRVPQPGDEWR